MRVLIAGIGNIFLGDDAFGVEMTRHLGQRSWPQGVSVHDFGIRCLDLAYMLLDDWDAAILVDAASRGGVPGTLYRIDLTTDSTPDENADAHSISAAQVRNMAKRLGDQVPGRLPAMWMIGCEPECLEPGELSAAVAAALPQAVTMIEHLINELEVQAA